MLDNWYHSSGFIQVGAQLGLKQQNGFIFQIRLVLTSLQLEASLQEVLQEHKLQWAQAYQGLLSSRWKKLHKSVNTGDCGWMGGSTVW